MFSKAWNNARKHMSVTLERRSDPTVPRTKETIAGIKDAGGEVINVGFSFASKDAFAVAAGEHSEHLGHIIETQVSNQVELRFKCNGDNCPHLIHGSYSSLGHNWLVNKFVDHSPNCKQGRMPRKRSNYEAKALARCVLPEILENLNVKPNRLATVLNRYTFFETSPSNRGYIRDRALRMLMDSPADAISKLPAIVHLLNKQGHAVKLLTMSPAKMKKVMLEVEKAKHEKLVEAYKKQKKKDPEKDPGKFDPRKCDTQCCDDCEEGTRFVYGFMFIPRTSIALFEASRGQTVFQSDAAHMFIAGTMLERVFQKSGHHTQELAVTFVYDNERYESWDHQYCFQSRLYGSGLNTPYDRNIGDQDKGMERAYAETFTRGTKFQCTNHMEDKVRAKGGANAFSLFKAAVQANSKAKCDTLKH